MRFHVLLAATLAVAACHHAKPAVTPVAPQPQAPPAQQQAAQQPVSTNIDAGADLVKECELHFANTEQAPKFDFNEAGLTTDDRDVLQQVADCVTKGPLKGKQLKLVGRADPRGTEEYNLGLGQRRAHSVGEYLEHLGVGNGQIAVSTRGSIDATGKDEDGWRTDRRVDLDIKD